jgi:hypothetical protein
MLPRALFLRRLSKIVSASCRHLLQRLLQWLAGEVQEVAPAVCCIGLY